MLVKPDLTKRGQSLFPNDNGDRDQLGAAYWVYGNNGDMMAAAFTQLSFGLQYCYYAAACIITIALEFRMNCENCLKFWLKQMEFICQNVEVKRFTFLYRHDINCPRIFSIGNHKTVKYVKERILFNSILNQTKCDLDILHLDI